MDVEDKDKSVIVAPELFPVSEDEIARLSSRYPVPEPLLAYWRELGWGFFNTGMDGSRLSDWPEG